MARTCRRDVSMAKVAGTAWWRRGSPPSHQPAPGWRPGTSACACRRRRQPLHLAAIDEPDHLTGSPSSPRRCGSLSGPIGTSVRDIRGVRVQRQVVLRRVAHALHDSISGARRESAEAARRRRRPWPAGSLARISSSLGPRTDGWVVIRKGSALGPLQSPTPQPRPKKGICCARVLEHSEEAGVPA